MQPSDHPGAVRRVGLSGAFAMKSRILRLVPVVGLAIAAGLYLGAARNQSEAPAPQSAGPVGPVGPAGSMSAGLRAAYVQARQLEAGSAYDFAPVDAESGVLRSANPALEVVTQAQPGGIRLQPAGAGGTKNSVGLQLVSQGCNENPSAAEVVAPQARGNRVEYARDGITEWYLNGPLGLEQGFTVTRDLGCRRKLVFEMALDKSVSAELQQRGTVLALNANGLRYRYGELYSYDAEGRELPSAMELSGQRLRLVVDAAGARYPVVVDPRMYLEVATLRASDGTTNDTYGIVVAQSGDTVLIASPNKNLSRGQVYVYTRSGLQWREQAKLTAMDPATLDNFGSSIAIDGNTAIIGAPQKNRQRGNAYVFLRTGTKWAQQAKLNASDGATGDYFGSAVGIKGDTAIVGISTPDRNTTYVYVRTGTTWSEQAKITPADAKPGDHVGAAVALDVDTALIGAPGRVIGTNTSPGRAYIYARTGTVWSEQAKLSISDGVANDKYGSAVALSGDTAVIGAYKRAVGNNVGQGEAFVYARSGTTWTEQARLRASDGAPDDRFGIGVATGPDVAVIGAEHATVVDNDGQGAAYVFSRTDGSWSQYTRLTAQAGISDDSFGRAVAVGTNGNPVVVGSYYRTQNNNPLQGEAYIFVFAPQAEGGMCADGVECLSGSCTNSICDPVTQTVTDMGNPSSTPDGNERFAIGAGYGSLGCSVSAAGPRSAGRADSRGMVGALFLVPLLLFLRRRNGGRA